MADGNLPRRVAGIFSTGPIGHIHSGVPQLVRAPLGWALVGGSLAIGLVGLGLFGIWQLGEPGHFLQRILLTALLGDYLHAGLMLRVEPELTSPVEVVWDRPLAYHDDHNRMLALVFVWLTPARWLAHKIAPLLLYRFLPTAEQLAERLYSEASPGPSDAARRVADIPHARPVNADEGAVFHESLRRGHDEEQLCILLACAAILCVGVAQLLELPDVSALAVALFVEALVQGLSVVAGSSMGAHPDLLHVWLSGQRPELAREGRQMARDQPSIVRVLFHALLAGALLLWINH